MYKRSILLGVSLVAGLLLLTGAFAADAPHAAAQQPCVIFFQPTASSANGAIICQPVPSCDAAGFITVTVIGVPGTAGTAACGTAGATCIVPPGGTFCTQTGTVPPQPPGTLLACVVNKPPGFVLPFITLATCF
jgi:hypothetical protein